MLMSLREGWDFISSSEIRVSDFIILVVEETVFHLALFALTFMYLEINGKAVSAAKYVRIYYLYKKSNS